MKIYILIYILFLIFAIGDFVRKRQQLLMLLLLAVILVIFIGFRNETGADSRNYITFFKEQTDTLWKWKNVEKGYAEHGFYYLSVLLKSIWNNVNFYFVSISLLTIFFLVKSLRRYSVYPILGLCIYYSRFLILRDMNQIRQALAVSILIYGLHYLILRKEKSFMVLVLIASMIHYSSLIIVPFFWLYNKKITFKSCIWILTFSSICGLCGGLIIKQILVSSGNMLMLTYVNVENLGIGNPVILFQIVVCTLFFHFESILKDKQEGYYIIRNAYLYSVVLLLLTCNLGEVGGRLATIFATCEIFIIPALALAIKPRICGYFVCLSIGVFLFALNYMKLLNQPDIWMYI